MAHRHAGFAVDACNFGRPVGRDHIIRTMEDILTTFPDWKVEIVEIVAVDDTVVVRARASGTHKGVGRRRPNGGLLFGVEPTWRSFTVEHIHWYRLRDGKIIDHYATRDDLGMMQQLGLLPTELEAGDHAQRTIPGSSTFVGADASGR